MAQVNHAQLCHHCQKLPILMVLHPLKVCLWRSNKLVNASLTVLASSPPLVALLFRAAMLGLAC